MKKLRLFTIIVAITLELIGCIDEVDSTSREPTYTVTIDNTEHGTITADKSSGISKGDTINLTVEPAYGFELDTLLVIDSENTNITLIPIVFGTKYTFIMPMSNVAVHVTYKEVLNIPAYKAGDIAKAAIKIDGVAFGKTTEVYVTAPDGATVIGKTPKISRVSSGTVNGKHPVTTDYGVFITGRTVTLSPFIMSKYEVTQELYTSVMTGQKVIVGGEEKTLATEPFYCMETGLYPLVSDEEQKYRPAEHVTWYDAIYFCNILSEKMGLTPAYNIEITSVSSTGQIKTATVTSVDNVNGYRLPTEAEWEFAARGGDPTADAWNYAFSGAKTTEEIVYEEAGQNNNIDKVGWYWYNNINGTTGDITPSSGNPGYGTHEVGLKQANTLGLYDMTGNIWEWCYDWYGGRFVEKGSVTNPTGASSGSYRILRGGSWTESGIASVCLHDAIQYPSDPRNDVGFRLVRSVQ